MDRYYLTALVLVLVMPLGGLAVGAALVAWARDTVNRSPLIGGIGVAMTLAAIGNLFVARSCGLGVNRPAFAVVVGDGTCYRMGLLSFELVLLLAVATAVVVRLGGVRR